ncbi:hypothetical protein [Hugonella massiliensis]|uniref:hypothetical protein n=1 Tax=Hugonella massiliensis TaxID=1720315 RepID=UPI0011DC84D2|nr:hypothetical protein [Hugonella massiliensis]
MSNAALLNASGVEHALQVRDVVYRSRTFTRSKNALTSPPASPASAKSGTRSPGMRVEALRSMAINGERFI